MQSANEGIQAIIKSLCCLDFAEKIETAYQGTNMERWHPLYIRQNTYVEMAKLPRKQEIRFELANEKLMHKFVTGAVVGALRPPDIAEMNLNFLIICRDNVPNMSPEARIDLVCPALTNKLPHFLIYMLLH